MTEETDIAEATGKKAMSLKKVGSKKSSSLNPDSPTNPEGYSLGDSEVNTEPTTPVDPIADHVNKLLRHYLTSERPMKGVPSLLFDDETGSVVLEYVSPGRFANEQSDRRV